MSEGHADEPVTVTDKRRIDPRTGEIRESASGGQERSDRGYASGGQERSDRGSASGPAPSGPAPGASGAGGWRAG